MRGEHVTFDVDTLKNDPPLSQVAFIQKLQNLPLVKNNKKQEFYNVPAAFDTETTSFYVGENKRATMYLWTFGIMNWKTYGRTWQEFIDLLDCVSMVLSLTPNRRLVIYVHNFPYEWQFMRKRFTWDKVFLLDERKPVYAITGGIEFRCSLKLSSKSLENVGKDLQKYKVEKKVGDLDYSLIRHSETPLSEKELWYALYDVIVVMCYIQEKIESDGNIALIPLTNTGYVRNHCRRECRKVYKHYRNIMNYLQLKPREYEQLKDCFQGGFTHANHLCVGDTLTDISSFDFTSSYPSVMVLEKFPMSSAQYIESVTRDELTKLMDEYCVMMDLDLYDVVPKIDYDHPISVSRCWEREGVLEDNGRLRLAKHIATTCTDVDFSVYEEFYDWSEMKISNVRYYEKGYLPHAIVNAILNLYEKKTTLKGVEGKEVEYMISKNMLNACYGMMVTDIVRDVYEYLDTGAYEKSNPDLDEAIEKYNKSRNRFLFYPWGVWVTAYARANLFSAILECGEDYKYSDTDSVKISNVEKHKEYFECYNKEILKLIDESAAYHRIDKSMYMPKNMYGEQKVIGQWDYEGTYDKFKTLGAKRYLTMKDGKYVMTVAGCSKKTAIKQLLKNGDPFEQFEDGMKITSEYSGRLTSIYIDEEFEVGLVDYTGKAALVNEMSCVHMEPAEYTMSMTEQFLKYIYGYKEERF